MASTVIDGAHAQGVSKRSKLTPCIFYLDTFPTLCVAVLLCVCACVHVCVFVGSTLATKVFIGDLQARNGGGSS